MTHFDWLVVGVVAFSVVLGFWRGMVSEVLSLAAWVAAFVIASRYSDEVAPLLYGALGEGALAHVAAFVLLNVLTMMAFALMKALLVRVLRAVGLGGLDRLLGAGFGFMRAVLVLVIVVMLAGMTDLPEKTWWREARFSRPLETAVMLASPYLPDALVNRIRFR